MKTAKAHAMVLLMFLLLTSACTENQHYNAKEMTDNELRSKFVGIWSATYDYPDYKVYGETYYKRDGTAVGRGEECIDGECTINTDTMNWKIVDGVLTGKFTSITGSDDIPVGFVFKDQILHIDTDVLIMRSRETGSTFTRNRVKKPLMLNSEDLSKPEVTR